MGWDSKRLEELEIERDEINQNIIALKSELDKPENNRYTDLSDKIRKERIDRIYQNLNHEREKLYRIDGKISDMKIYNELELKRESKEKEFIKEKTLEPVVSKEEMSTPQNIDTWNPPHISHEEAEKMNAKVNPSTKLGESKINVDDLFEKYKTPMGEIHSPAEKEVLQEALKDRVPEDKKENKKIKKSVKKNMDETDSKIEEVKTEPSAPISSPIPTPTPIDSKFSEVGGKLTKENNEKETPKEPKKKGFLGKLFSGGGKVAGVGLGVLASAGAVAGGVASVGAGAVKNKAKETKEYLKECFNGQTNGIFLLAFMNLLFDYFYRFYFGTGAFNTTQSMMFDTVILFIVLFGIIKLHLKVTIGGVILYVVIITNFADKITLFLTTMIHAPDYVIGIILRFVVLCLPILIFCYVPFFKDDDLNSKKELILYAFFACLWETGLQSVVYNTIKPMITNVGFLNIFMFSFFIVLNGWFLLAWLFSEYCPPSGFSKHIKNFHWILICVLLLLTVFGNWPDLEKMWATNDTSVKTDQEQAQIGVIEQIQNKVNYFTATFACEYGADTLAFASFLPSKEKGCAELEALKKEDNKDLREAQVDATVKYNTFIIANEQYNNKIVSSFDTLAPSFTLQISSNDYTEDTKGTLSCYFNNINNPGFINDETDNMSVSTTEGNLEKSYTCTLPDYVENDAVKVYNYFGGNRRFDLIYMFSYDLLLSTSLKLKFKNTPIAYNKNGAQDTDVKTRESSTSPKKSAIFTDSVAQDMPILVDKDETKLILDFSLDNGADGNIKKITDAYIIMPNSISILLKNNDTFEQISTITDKKIIKELEKRTAYVEKTFLKSNIYKLKSDGMEKINKDVENNNEWVIAIPLVADKSALFDVTNMPKEIYLDSVVSYTYEIKKTQSATLGDELFSSLDEKRKNANAASDATYVNINTNNLGNVRETYNLYKNKLTILKPTDVIVDEKLLAAIIHKESTGNPFAISPTGCAGLLQFCYETAQPYFSTLTLCKNGCTLANDDRFNADKSISAGYKFTNSLMSEFSGKSAQTEFALASYNGGQCIVNKAITATGNTNPSWSEVSQKINEEIIKDCYTKKNGEISEYFDTQNERNQKVIQITDYVEKVMFYYGDLKNYNEVLTS